MQHRLILPLLCCFAGFAQNAHAVPIIDKSQAAAEARTDPGTGICGSITHFTAGQPLVKQSEAEALLNKPTTDPAILGRTARLFDNINFRNGQPNTNGDFTLPNYRDEVFPYSMDPKWRRPWVPTRTSPCDLRGYFNVPGDAGRQDHQLRGELRRLLLAEDRHHQRGDRQRAHLGACDQAGELQVPPACTRSR